MIKYVAKFTMATTVRTRNQTGKSAHLETSFVGTEFILLPNDPAQAQPREPELAWKYQVRVS